MKLRNLIDPSWIASLFALGFGGGSSGGSSGVKYDNLESLYGTQNQAAQFMLDQAMPNLQKSISNSASMTSDAMDGTLSKQMQEQAGNNATATMGAALDANNRNMQRYGMSFDANRLLSENNRDAIMGAATKAGAMNLAATDAENMKWNRNAGYYAQASGTGNGAMAGISSAASGLSGIANMQNQNDIANAQGYGQAGAALAYGMMKADGGYIDGEFVRVDDESHKKEPKMASGGFLTWDQYKSSNPVQVSNSSVRKGTSPVLAILSGAAPQMIGKAIKTYGPKAYDTIKAMYNGPSYDSTGAPVGITYGGDIGADGAIGSTAGAAAGVGGDVANAGAGDVVANTATTYATPVADTASGIEEFVLKDGGYAKKKAPCMAKGGMFKIIQAEPTVAGLDASSSMAMPSVSSIDSKPKSLPAQAAQAAAQQTPYNGDTTGEGDTSTNDKDGFGKYNADSRGIVGKGVFNYVFPIAGMVNTALGNPLHQIAEPATREVITTGDSIDGVNGAMAMDPVATPLSGKYKPSEIVKATIGPAMGMPFLSDFLADGGSPAQRVDMTPGGEVSGPGSETSDSIPSWLSDGEHVQNADAVKIAGKGILDKINNDGLAVRYGKKSPGAAQRDMGMAMIRRGIQLAQGQGGR